MNLTKLFKMLCFGVLGLSFFSCDSSNDYVDAPAAVFVRKVEAQANFDLSARSGWKFYVGGYEYAFDMEEGKVVATPFSEATTFSYLEPLTGGQMYVVTKLVPENYLKTRAFLPGGGSTIVANLENQGTLEGFTACDVLYQEYLGTAKENLMVQLLHENALLRLGTINLPEDAKVYVKQIHNQKITPLKQTETEYQAIVFSNNTPSDIAIVVEANGKIYESNLYSVAISKKDVGRGGIEHGTVISCTAEIINEKLTVKLLSAKFSSSEWPITQ